MDKLAEITSLLQALAEASHSKPAVFFKTGPGQYAEHDRFIGVSVPNLRQIAKRFSDLALDDIQTLLNAPVNEERFLALIILVNRYTTSDKQAKEAIYQFYLSNLKQINNWNLVDASAHCIIGAHHHNENKGLLITLAKSNVMWERRIAIVSTWYFIRHNDLEWTFKIATLLLDDEEDLIHKAVGWMLREAGKKNVSELKAFLNQYAAKMPRTMLRYAIEKLTDEQRKTYLNTSKITTRKR